MIIHDPENTFKCDHIYAYISEDENGLQGIVAFNGMPLIFASPKMVERCECIAKQQSGGNKGNTFRGGL